MTYLLERTLTLLLEPISLFLHCMYCSVEHHMLPVDIIAIATLPLSLSLQQDRVTFFLNSQMTKKMAQCVELNVSSFSYQAQFYTVFFCSASKSADHALTG